MLSGVLQSGDGVKVCTRARQEGESKCAQVRLLPNKSQGARFEKEGRPPYGVSEGLEFYESYVGISFLRTS